MLKHALDPRSVAVIGASENPHKVGGRPILFMKRYGFKGALYPVNPARAEVQGLRAYPSVEALPQTPELVVVAVAGDEAVKAVEACAKRGVKAAVVMASGFGETGEAGKRVQDAMVATARAAGMRLIGPNCQGIANFATGVVANFSTIFHEMDCRDGPVAIVSQSGANSQAIYALLRARGLNARHVHATGNEADVTVADLADAIVEEQGMRLVLLYMESIKNPALLAQAAEKARERDLPIVALKAGRTASGQKAASSHTGALAAEDRVVDAFFERHGIWRAADPHQLVSAAELYCAGRRPRGKRFVFVSNSGASCVMAADYSDRQGLPLAPITARGKEGLKKVLPAFASLSNPIDITGALLTNPKLFGQVLAVVGEDAQADLVLAGLPVAGAGYDVGMFAADLRAFNERYGLASALASPQEKIRSQFAQAGVATFASEPEAMDALAQVADHAALLRRTPRRVEGQPRRLPPGSERFFNEAESLALLAGAGVPVIEHRLCRSEEEADAAKAALGEVVMKICSPDIPHKSDHGLVALGVADAAAEFCRQREQCLAMGARFDGVIVARRAAKARELALGARLDPQFGPVVLVGDGGIYLEALKDFRLLLPPFDEEEVVLKLNQLRIGPLLGALRGIAARDVMAFAAMAVKLGDAMLAWEGRVASVDINPVLVFETGQGALAVDALVERAL
ncbi:MAG TPA: acetate--CoA ligase family protein [Burkholderiales bacterium]|nr:acetate--CoA ligase family protein [Burkholderiales bacterium]